MSNELKNELKIELSCGRCGLTKVIMVNLDEDGVFTIPNKFCPNDLSELSREVLRNFVSVPEPKPIEKFISLNNEKLQAIADKNAIKKPDEPTEDKTRTSNAVSKPTRPVDMPKHGADSSKKT